MDELNLRCLRYFLAVAEHEHFGAAAAQLYISQSALSAEVKRLESDFEVKLFDRTPRSVHLTRAGEVLREDAIDLLARAAELGRHVQSSTSESGRLRVGFVHTVLYRGLPEIAAEFRLRFPDVELDLIEMNSAEQAAQLRAGSVDLTIGHDARTPIGVASRLLTEEPFVVCLPATHSFASADEVDVSHLAGRA